MSIKFALIHRLRALLHPFWLLPVLSIPALWAFVLHGLPQTHDGGLHLMRLTLLDYHFQNGLFYPRWVPELLLGQGYPLFNFYAPLTYYLAELLQLGGLGSHSAIIVTFALFVWIGAWGAYCLARDFYETPSRGPALVVAVAYLYAPYLLTNIFVRGAIAEVAAQALLPWIFWSARRTMRHANPDLYALALAVSLGGLAVTHNITLLLTPPILVLYLFLLWQQTGFSLQRLMWAGGGLLLAMGLSAFFWLPMVGERHFLAETAFGFARTYMTQHVWRWDTFLDRNWIFVHDGIVPFQVGLVEVLLAILGFVLAKRHREWWFWAGMTGLSVLLMWHWSLPLWLNIELLQVAQFPWRLISLLTLPLALFAGGSVVRLHAPIGQTVASVALIVLIVITHYPRLSWAEVRPVFDGTNLSAIAQLEAGAQWLGSGHSREFWPAWSENAATLDATGLSEGTFNVTLVQASPYELVADVSSTTGGPLRFNNYFFPTWRAAIDGEESAIPYPSTSLGLVTVDLPPGDHRIHLYQESTTVQKIAAWITFITLAVSSLFVAWDARRRSAPRRYWLAAAMMALIVLGATTALSKPSLGVAQQPSAPVQNEQITLTGYRTEIHGRFLQIFPYWYVRSQPAAELKVRWQLQDDTGQVINEITSRPWFYTTLAAMWAPGSLVDDAYRLALPVSDSPHSYTLAVQLLIDDADLLESSATISAPVTIGTVTAPPIFADEPEPDHAFAVRFADQVTLTGYDFAICGRPERPCTPCVDGRCTLVGQQIESQDFATVVKPGDVLSYTFYWKALTTLSRNYHSFLHLVNANGQTLVQDDQLAATFASPSRSWDQLAVQPDLYRLTVPPDAPNGLFWPRFGLYFPLQEIHYFTEVERLPIDDGSDTSPDAIALPPIKVFGQSPPAALSTPANFQFDGLGHLIGYDLSTPDTVTAGSSLTLTVQYEAAKTLPLCEGEQIGCAPRYIRTAQLYNPALGMAAQQDGEPRAGQNPTWAWLPGEIVQETVTLTLAQNVQPGDYTLFLAFYTPDGSRRVRATDEQGEPLPDQLVPLTTVRVE